MRLQEMFHAIRVNAPKARLESSPQPNMPGKLRITNVEPMRTAVANLRQIPILQGAADSVSSHPVFFLVEGSIIEQDQIHDFSQRTSALVSLAQQVQSLVTQAAPPHDPNGLHIRVPPLSSLRELGDFVKSMDQVFDQPARRLFGDGVKFSGFDIGSDWLMVTPEMLDGASVAGKAVMAVGVVSLVKKSEAIRDFIFDFLKAFQQWRSDKVRYQTMLANAEYFQGSVKLASDIRAMQAEIAEQQKKLIVTQLIRAQEPGVDPAAITEAHNAASHGMSELDKWVIRGAEVHAAIDAPESVRKLLPEPVTATAPMPKQLSAKSDDQK